MALVESHGAAVQALASGIHGLPGVTGSFAATQGAYRLLHNPRVTLGVLAAPVVQWARQQAAAVCDDHALMVHDWSQLMYAKHTGKKDRIALSGRKKPDGYEIQTALMVSDRDGLPIAPLEISLHAADGVHESRSAEPRAALSRLDELAPAMRYVEQLALPRRLVHVIDAEADSVAHYREWAAANSLFLVRADDRLVEHDGTEKRCSMIQAELHSAGRMQQTREVLYHGQHAQQWVGEVPVVLTRAAQRNRPGTGDKRRIPGDPLPLRLVIAEVRTFKNERLATWFLLTNVPDKVPMATIALWYYWRWNIETFFKLLKSAGQQIEEWQQESAEAIARRLWIACMACATVWSLARSQHPRADAARRLLVRLSGRQMKRGVAFTMPALLAGLWTMLAMLEVLEHHSLSELRELATLIRPTPQPP